MNVWDYILKAIRRTHLHRAMFWALSCPVIFIIGWQDSIVILFIWSTYANFIGDIDAYVAQKAEEAHS